MCLTSVPNVSIANKPDIHKTSTVSDMKQSISLLSSFISNSDENMHATLHLFDRTDCSGGEINSKGTAGEETNPAGFGQSTMKSTLFRHLGAHAPHPIKVPH